MARFSLPDRWELGVLIGAFLAILLLLGFVVLAAQVLGGNTQEVDERVLAALRRPDDPSRPIGPAWLYSAALDLTALGGAPVLGLAIASIAGFLALQGLRRTALFILIASSGVWLFNALLKELFQRPRPSVVPHLQEVMTLSFPSGHAMVSAAVYLTLGALLMHIARRRVTKIYCMAIALGLTVLIGSSRVYLGVHYPTDVLAGWLVGLSWAVMCWLVERSIERRAGLRRERIEQEIAP